MKPFIYTALTCLFLACTPKEEKQQTKKINVAEKTTEKIPFTPLTEDCLKEGELVVLLNNSLFSYLLYRGKTLGYEYELLQMFCKDNGLKLKIKVVQDAGHILDSLEAGHGHLAAANITINAERKKTMDFSEPFFKTKQMLVQRMPKNWRKMTLDGIQEKLIKDPLDLANKSVTVQKNTVFYDRLSNFSEENAVNIEVLEAAPTVTTEDLIELVDRQEIDYTVADQNTLSFYNAFYSDLDFDTAISFNQNIAWAVNKSQQNLLKKINSWIKRNKGGLALNMLNSRYFDITKTSARNIKKGWSAAVTGELSPYDELIKEHATIQDMDWLLLAALIFQESKFDPRSKSWAGAMGLTQVMPATAGDLGIKNANLLYQPKISVRVGSKYFKQLIDYWQPVLKDSVEANYFALASYNAGKGHVLDARRLAIKIGKNQNKWIDNVEDAMLLKSNPEYYKDPVVKYGYCVGKEPVGYVRNIKGFYENFNTYLNQKINNTEEVI